MNAYRAPRLLVLILFVADCVAVLAAVKAAGLLP